MGVDSKAYVPYLNREELVSFLEFIGKNVNLESTSYQSYKTISFKFGEEDRILHTHDLDLREEKVKERYKKEGWTYNYEKTEYASYLEQGLPDGTYGLLLDFSLWGQAIELLTIICKRFGGYLDENDSDDKPFYKIDKDLRDIIIILMHI